MPFFFPLLLQNYWIWFQYVDMIIIIYNYVLAFCCFFSLKISGLSCWNVYSIVDFVLNASSELGLFFDIWCKMGVPTWRKPVIYWVCLFVIINAFVQISNALYNFLYFSSTILKPCSSLWGGFDSYVGFSNRSSDQLSPFGSIPDA